MKLLRAALAAILVSLLCFAYVEYSDDTYAETARSFLATKLPEVFGRFRKLNERPIKDRIAEAGFQPGQPVLIRIFKQENTLELWMNRSGQLELAMSYPICTWSGNLGPKLREGDRQSPEGYYLVSANNLNPNSSYHRAINIGFPNSYDIALNRTGTFLMIHGSCVSIGCYAMTDAVIDDVYNLVASALAHGQTDIPIHVFPFRLTDENLSRHDRSPWIDFWKNLAEGDRIFLATRLPPQVSVCGNRYFFGSADKNCAKVTSW
jgi:murein L,D-transpeptidase YafK